MTTNLLKKTLANNRILISMNQAETRKTVPQRIIADFSANTHPTTNNYAIFSDNTHNVAFSPPSGKPNFWANRAHTFVNKRPNEPVRGSSKQIGKMTGIHVHMTKAQPIGPALKTKMTREPNEVHFGKPRVMKK